MQLLFVPVMLAVFAGGLTWWQTSSERTRLAEEAARQEALRAQYTAVQAYIDQMTSLVLQEDLRSSNDVQTIAQARTSGVLQAVEPENQRTLLQFLSEANLIQGAMRILLSSRSTVLTSAPLTSVISISKALI
jgi:hypothetical protein